jgi:hypothetical protein
MICAEEFDMADDAFALSPISARASLPSEEDYEAISQAFMETSRGRWFLGEYARRNRNADTRMVLDAVARIEETLFAQQQPAPESGLPEALATIRGAVDQAQATAAAAVERLALEENLAPIRKGVRIIREISWQWREIGADSRICDLLDSQVGAIEAACGQITSANASDTLSAAFDLIKAEIAEFDASDKPPSQGAEEAAASPASAPRDEAPAAVAETVQAVSAAETAMEMPAKAVVETDEAVETAAEAADVTVEAADAHDEALLDLIALEMSAPDPDDIDEAPAAPAPDVAEMAEPIAAPAVQASLGSSLIANGMVRRPRASDADPLAPIRRMSQAEKIAFFS